MTKDEALAKCKYYDGTEKSIEKNDYARREYSFVNFSQLDAKGLKDMVLTFKKSPAHKLMSLIKGDEDVIACIYARYCRWTDADPMDKEIVDDFWSYIKNY